MTMLISPFGQFFLQLQQFNAFSAHWNCLSWFPFSEVPQNTKWSALHLQGTPYYSISTAQCWDVAWCFFSLKYCDFDTFVSLTQPLGEWRICILSCHQQRAEVGKLQLADRSSQLFPLMTWGGVVKQGHCCRAAGAVGSTVCQLLLQAGCHVVGSVQGCAHPQASLDRPFPARRGRCNVFTNVDPSLFLGCVDPCQSAHTLMMLVLMKRWTS